MGLVWQVFNGFGNFSYNGLCAVVEILEDQGEPTNAFDERRHICLPKLLFEQHRIALSMSELAAVGHVVRVEQNTDISVGFWIVSPPNSPWPTGDTVDGQVPPHIFTHPFFGIDVAINRFLTDPGLRAFMDHSVANLFRRPSVLENLKQALAECRVSDQFAISRTSIYHHNWATPP
tara:strand:- start:19765 stop:20292 length:528 start_codon:yes stop_codon:yes gene_type:complete